MKNITDNLKNAVIVFGLLILTFAPLEGQKFETSQNFKPLTVKVGVAYNIVQIDELSKNCLGIETLLEKKLKDKLFAEWEIGLYADTRATSAFIYSKMQTNMGLEYKPIMKNGWAMGGKAAIGVSSEFYKEIEEIVPSKRISLNKLIGLDAEKVFRNGAGINLGVSREIDRNIWIIGIKGILKPVTESQVKAPVTPQASQQPQSQPRPVNVPPEPKHQGPSANTVPQSKIPDTAPLTHAEPVATEQMPLNMPNSSSGQQGQPIKK